MTRVTQTADSEKTFKIPLTVEGNKTILKHTFTRTMNYIKQNEFLARLELKIDGKEGGL